MTKIRLMPDYRNKNRDLQEFEKILKEYRIADRKVMQLVVVIFLLFVLIPLGLLVKWLFF